MNIETLRAEHPDLVSQIETAARVGFVAADSMPAENGAGPMCGTCSCKDCAGGECATCTKNPHMAKADSADILALHSTVFGEEAGKKFAAIVESGVSADQAKALGITVGSGETTAQAAILAALTAAAPAGLKPGQVSLPAAATIDTSAIYSARQQK
jgi:hypothetical protein